MAFVFIFIKIFLNEFLLISFNYYYFLKSHLSSNFFIRSHFLIFHPQIKSKMPTNESVPNPLYIIYREKCTHQTRFRKREAFLALALALAQTLNLEPQKSVMAFPYMEAVVGTLSLLLHFHDPFFRSLYAFYNNSFNQGFDFRFLTQWLIFKSFICCSLLVFGFF